MTSALSGLLVAVPFAPTGCLIRLQVFLLVAEDQLGRVVHLPVGPSPAVCRLDGLVQGVQLLKGLGADDGGLLEATTSSSTATSSRVLARTSSWSSLLHLSLILLRRITLPGRSLHPWWEAHWVGPAWSAGAPWAGTPWARGTAWTGWEASPSVHKGRHHSSELRGHWTGRRGASRSPVHIGREVAGSTHGVHHGSFVLRWPLASPALPLPARSSGRGPRPHHPTASGFVQRAAPFSPTCNILRS